MSPEFIAFAAVVAAVAAAGWAVVRARKNRGKVNPDFYPTERPTPPGKRPD